MRDGLRTAALALLVVITALAVVYVRHEARLGFVALQQLESERDELTTDWGRLQLEYATWADGSRVESLARDRLGLVDAQPTQVMIIVE